jgi:hypothetical protein
VNRTPINGSIGMSRGGGARFRYGTGRSN